MPKTAKEDTTLKRPRYEDDPIGWLNWGLDRTGPMVGKPGRQGHGGGGKRHPNSIAALEAHRPNIARMRHCSREGCRQPAVKGLEVCRLHGGAKTVRERRLAAGKPITSRPEKLGESRVFNLMLSGRLPTELVMSAPFVALREIIERDRQFGYKGGAPEMAYRRACQTLIVEITNAWLLRDQTGDPGPWVSAVQKCRELGVV